MRSDAVSTAREARCRCLPRWRGFPGRPDAAGLSAGELKSPCGADWVLSLRSPAPYPSFLRRCSPEPLPVATASRRRHRNAACRRSPERLPVRRLIVPAAGGATSAVPGQLGILRSLREASASVASKQASRTTSCEAGLPLLSGTRCRNACNSSRGQASGYAKQSFQRSEFSRKNVAPIRRVEAAPLAPTYQPCLARSQSRRSRRIASAEIGDARRVFSGLDPACIPCLAWRRRGGCRRSAAARSPAARIPPVRQSRHLMSRSRASDVDACPVSASLLGEQRQRLLPAEVARTQRLRADVGGSACRFHAVVAHVPRSTTALRKRRRTLE